MNFVWEKSEGGCSISTWLACCTVSFFFYHHQNETVKLDLIISLSERNRMCLLVETNESWIPNNSPARARGVVQGKCFGQIPFPTSSHETCGRLLSLLAYRRRRIQTGDCGVQWCKERSNGATTQQHFAYQSPGRYPGDELWNNVTAFIPSRATITEHRNDKNKWGLGERITVVRFPGK